MKFVAEEMLSRADVNALSQLVVEAITRNDARSIELLLEMTENVAPGLDCSDQEVFTLNAACEAVERAVISMRGESNEIVSKFDLDESTL